MACKKGQFDVVELTFSINLDTQHVNGMTPFDLCTIIRYSRVHNCKKDSAFVLSPDDEIVLE